MITGDPSSDVRGLLHGLLGAVVVSIDVHACTIEMGNAGRKASALGSACGRTPASCPSDIEPPISAVKSLPVADEPRA
jgi:hypothetical protein